MFLNPALCHVDLWEFRERINRVMRMHPEEGRLKASLCALKLYQGGLFRTKRDYDWRSTEAEALEADYRSVCDVSLRLLEKAHRRAEGLLILSRLIRDYPDNADYLTRHATIRTRLNQESRQS